MAHRHSRADVSMSGVATVTCSADHASGSARRFRQTRLWASSLTLALLAPVSLAASAGPLPSRFPAAAPTGSTVAGPATSAMLQPFRGSGTWLDVYDWSKQFGGAAFKPSDVDKVAAAGYQTIYIQTTKAGVPDLVLESARLKAIINRAHQLGLSVVGWYLPTHDDEMRDYRKTIAMLRLGVDGIGLDLESTKVKNVPKRSAAAVRLMHRLDAKLRAARIDIGVAAITYTPYTLESSRTLWPNFPWAALAPYTSVWMPMSYWSQQIKRNNGYSDATKFTNATIGRLREILGAGARIHLIGGSGQSPTQAAKMVAAVNAAGGNVIGASLYDWRTSASGTHPRMQPLRALRGVAETATSEPISAADSVVYRTASGTLTLVRLAADGSVVEERSIAGASIGVPAVAVNKRTTQHRWLVAVGTTTGAAFAVQGFAGATSRLSAVPGAPARCTPTATSWARSGYVLLCRVGDSVTFAQFSVTTRRWSQWRNVPVPAGATSVTAAPLGSDIALAWVASDGGVHMGLWDPATADDLVARDVVDAGGTALASTSALRLNSEVVDGEDTANKVYLSWRSPAGAWRVSVQRSGLFAPSVTAPAATADAQTGAVTDAYISGGSRVSVSTKLGVVSYRP